MVLLLEIVKGRGAGNIFPLSPGIRIGRSKTNNIRIPDEQISSEHAAVLQNNGCLILTDLGSSNGIKVNGVRHDKIELKEGVIFTLGSTWLRVTSHEHQRKHPFVEGMVKVREASAQETRGSIKEVLLTPLSDSPEREFMPQIEEVKVTSPDQKDQVEFKKTQGHSYKRPAKPPIPAEFASWQRELARAILDASRAIKDDIQPVSALMPPLELRFTQGCQFDTTWILGYGPRSVGARSFELPILEPNAPDICFEILPGKDGPAFRTPYPDRVLLNGSPQNSITLKDGDTISIGATKIEIKLQP